MTTRRLKAVVAVVAVLGTLQILFEDVVVFLGATGTGGSALANNRYVLIAVPLLISLLLVAVLIGGSILYSDRMR